MKNIHYKITFHSYWHCGSGLAAGADVDALVVKDKDGLPYIPGKTIKGLVREAVNEMLALMKMEESTADYLSLFGYFEDDKKDMRKSVSFFTNAELKEAKSIKNGGLQRYLFTSVAQTAIDAETGTAKKHSLRKTEVVVPCVLEGDILNVPDGMVDTVKNALKFIKCMGLGRNRGLGRCTISGKEYATEHMFEEREVQPDVLMFKVKLLSDIIINQKAASEGPNKTLDFIPGSNFLGIVAGKLYKELAPEDALYIFHSGHVRFGDAHLGNGGSRCHKVPAAMFHPKLEKASEKLYISHLIPKDEDTQDEMRRLQLKQCRNGFYDFTQNPATPASISTSFAIKSAHDITTRTSKDGQMYGYESLSKGSVLYFEVEVDDEKYVEPIIKALIGKKRVGRSRSAQYGLVEISQCPYEEVGCGKASGDRIIVYADSRMIFLDKNIGLPTFRPEAKDLGVESGQIDWEESQIRTFQYAPWNYQRQCFDTDRCGIEKGSVIVVKNATGCPTESQYVGCYKNEGFGRVIYNPAFLDGDIVGKAKCLLGEKNPENNIDPDEENTCNIDTPLMRFLSQVHSNELSEQDVYEQVNKWIQENSHLFTKDAFASQWGTIRSIATQKKSKDDIQLELFEKKQIDRNGRTVPMAYLTHGVAKDKWKGDRLKSFRLLCKETLGGMSDRYYRYAIINLAAEMAKRCRKEN